MNDDRWDGYCAVEASSGGTRHRVRGSRMVDGSSGSTAYRIRGDGRVVDVDTGETRFRVRDDGRVVDVTTGKTIWRWGTTTDQWRSRRCARAARPDRKESKSASCHAVRTRAIV